MDIKQKAILMNVAIVAGLAFYYWRGTSLLIIGITAFLLLGLVNVTLALQTKRGNRN